MPQRTSRSTAVVVVVVIASALAACAPPSPGEGEGEGDGACPVSALGRELVEQTLTELFAAASFTTSETHGGFAVDVALQQDLVGLDVGVAQGASLFFPCTEPTAFEPSCDSALDPEPSPDPFFVDHDRCFRLGCTAADQPFADVYFTMKPATSADERHAFTASTTAPAGTSAYALNPLVRWEVDLRDPAQVLVHADVAVDHAFTSSADGEVVDASFTAVVDGTQVPAEPEALVTLDVAGAFAGLHFALHEGDDGVLTGALTDGDGGAVVATVDGPVDPAAARLPLSWIDACE